jgi:hypothetical protein
MVDENEDLAHRQPVSGRRWLDDIEIFGLAGSIAFGKVIGKNRPSRG